MDKNLINQRIQTLENKLETFPTINLICAKNDTRYKWYTTDGKNQIYLSKANRQLAEQLAQKKYVGLQLESARAEMNLCRAKERYEKCAMKEAKFLSHPEYQKLLRSHLSHNSEIISRWMNEPYEMNHFRQEAKIFKTPSGILVHSKSEVFIAMTLTKYQIPFRYECLLDLDEHIYYPDFTILHPTKLKLYYWEHFGLMDSSNYVDKQFQKLQTYAHHDIIPTINLITTYETKEHPLTLEDAERICEEYFLK